MHQAHKQWRTAQKGLLAKELDGDYIVKIYIPFLTIDSDVSKLIQYAWAQQSRESESKDHRSSSQMSLAHRDSGQEERCAGLCCIQLCIFFTGVDAQALTDLHLASHVQWIWGHNSNDTDVCLPYHQSQQKFVLIIGSWDITAHETNFKILTNS